MRKEERGTVSNEEGREGHSDNNEGHGKDIGQ